MIRVNLLRNRKEGLQGLVSESNGASSFISGREVALAGLFLVLGGAILWFVLGRQAVPGPAVAAEDAGPSSTPEASIPATAPADTTANVSLPAGEPPVLPAALDASQAAGLPVADSRTDATPDAAADAPRPDAPTGASVAEAPPSGSAAASAAASLSPSLSKPPVAAPGQRGSTLLSQHATTSALDKSAAGGTGGGAGLESATVGAASDGVITLRDLRILGQGDSLQIVAATNGLPAYKMFQVEKPNRVVIDLAGVRQEIPREEREQIVPNSVVKQVRIAQNQIDPPLVRLVLEVESFPELQIVPRPDGLLINVTGR